MRTKQLDPEAACLCVRLNNQGHTEILALPLNEVTFILNSYLQANTDTSINALASIYKSSFVVQHST